MRKNIIPALFIITFWIALPFVLVYSGQRLDNRYAFTITFAPIISIGGFLLILISMTLLLLAIYQFIRTTKKLPISATPSRLLIQNGLYAVWRHPIYLFYTLFFTGIALILPSFSMLVFVIPVFIAIELIYIYIEERYLIKRFGDQYLHYRQKTPLLIPTLANILRLPVFILFKLFFGYHISGKENIPAQPPFFIVAAHKNYLDPFYIATAVGYPIKFITTFEVFRSPFSRFFFKKLHCLALKRYCLDLAALRNIIQAIENQWVIGIFPEGERSWTGRTLTFKPEVLKLLKRYHDIPVLPVQITGNYLAWPRWAKKPVHNRVEVHFKKPLTSTTHYQLPELETQLLNRLHSDQPVASQSLNSEVKNINLVIYRCPACHAFDSFTFDQHTRFICIYCRTPYTMLTDGRIQYHLNGSAVQQTIDELYQQVKIKTIDIHPVCDQNKICSKSARLYVERGDQLIRLFNGNVLLDQDRLWFQNQIQSFSWELKKLTSVTIESNCKLQIFDSSESRLYQITFKHESVLKWQDLILEKMSKEFGWIPNHR